MLGEVDDAVVDDVEDLSAVEVDEGQEPLDRVRVSVLVSE